MVAGYLLITKNPSEQLATLVILAVSFVVMAWRAVYARHNGLWKTEVSWSAEALKPERTAVVTMGIVVLIAAVGIIGGLDTPSEDKSVSVLVSLFLTGGLFTALITSPHNLIDLVKAERERKVA